MTKVMIKLSTTARLSARMANRLHLLTRPAMNPEVIYADRATRLAAVSIDGVLFRL